MRRSVRDMKVGEVGYVVPWAMDNPFVHYVYPSPRGTACIRVERMTTGVKRNLGGLDDPGSCGCGEYFEVVGESEDGLRCPCCWVVWERCGDGWQRATCEGSVSLTLRIDSGPTETVTLDGSRAADEALTRLAIAMDRTNFEHVPIAPAPTRSVHQERLARRSAHRPLPGDKRAPRERKRRRWFWPAIVALFGAALAVVSALDGGLGLYERWRQSAPTHRLLDSVKVPEWTIGCTSDCACHGYLDGERTGVQFRARWCANKESP
jgi:hypothetical protein